MNKSRLIILLPILIIGCTNNSDDINLSCNGYSEIINVYGKNIEEKKEPSIVPVQIQRVNKGLLNYFKDPIYKVWVNQVYFDENSIYSNKEIIVGQKDPDRNSTPVIDQTFNLNRNTGHLIFKDSTFYPPTKNRLNSQDTSYFQGKCEKVKEKI